MTNPDKVSAAGEEAIAGWEGVVLTPYYDIAGILTNGIGHTNAAGGAKVVRGEKWTRDYAFKVFRDDLSRSYAPAVFSRFAGTRLTQAAFDAFTSHHFNTGAVKTASYVDAFKRGDMADAKTRFLSWDKARVKGKLQPVAGLTRRRREEWAMAELGQYPAGVKSPPAATAGGPAPVQDPTSSPTRRRTSSNVPDQAVTDIQRLLTDLGFYKGKIDGLFGPGTEKAVKSFQQTHPDLTPDGVVGPATWNQLLRNKDLRARATVTVAGGGLTGAGTTAIPDVPLWFTAGVLGAVVLVLVWLAWRYWPEIQQRFTKRQPITVED
jgi:lysozyme